MSSWLVRAAIGCSLALAGCPFAMNDDYFVTNQGPASSTPGEGDGGAEAMTPRPNPAPQNDGCVPCNEESCKSKGETCDAGCKGKGCNPDDR